MNSRANWTHEHLTYGSRRRSIPILLSRIMSSLSPRVARMALAALMISVTPAMAGAGPELVIRRIEAAPRLADFESPAARAQGIALQMARVEGFTARLPQDGLPLSEQTEVYL